MAEKLGEVAVEIRAETEKFKAEIDEAQRIVDEFGVTAAANARKGSEGFDDLGRSVEDINAALGRLATGAAIITGAVVGVKEFVEFLQTADERSQDFFKTFQANQDAVARALGVEKIKERQDAIAKEFGERRRLIDEEITRVQEALDEELEKRKTLGKSIVRAFEQGALAAQVRRRAESEINDLLEKRQGLIEKEGAARERAAKEAVAAERARRFELAKELRAAERQADIDTFAQRRALEIELADGVQKIRLENEQAIINLLRQRQEAETELERNRVTELLELRQELNARRITEQYLKEEDEVMRIEERRRAERLKTAREETKIRLEAEREITALRERQTQGNDQIVYQLKQVRQALEDLKLRGGGAVR